MTAPPDGDPHDAAIERVIDARARELAGLSVRRVLPALHRRTVGPFIFLDHMGTHAIAPGGGVDVPPHPHIGLATVTYLYEGELVHRDSLGSQQPIRPGDVNWMTAGRGVVHSERTAADQRAAGGRLHGLQLWVALPIAHEDAAPTFHHHPARTLPELELDGVRVRVLAGAAHGVTSPIATLSPLAYVDATLPAGAALPVERTHAERAVYVVDGEVTCAGTAAGPGRLLVLAPGAEVVVRAVTPARLALLAGAPLDGPRLIDWNFVASSRARIEQARADWRDRRFPLVPGDEHDFVPLPR